jgi:hypothetical protein
VKKIETSAQQILGILVLQGNPEQPRQISSVVLAFHRVDANQGSCTAEGETQQRLAFGISGGLDNGISKVFDLIPIQVVKCFKTARL